MAIGSRCSGESRCSLDGPTVAVGRRRSPTRQERELMVNAVTSPEVCQSAEAALVRLWANQRAALLRRCRHYLRHSEADAEDAFGRATLAMVQSARDLAELRSPAAWLGEIVRNACIDVHREHTRRREETWWPAEFEDGSPNELELPGGDLDPEHMCMQRETAEAIWHAVDALPHHLRAPLLLRAEEDMSYAAMATVLFDSEENLRKRVQVARRMIAESLERHRADESRGQPSMNRRFLVTGREAAASLVAPVPLPIRSFHAAVWAVETPSGTAHGTVFLPMPAPLPRYVSRSAQRLRRYVQKHPTGWRKRLLLADMLLQAGRFDESVRHYHAVVARRHGHWEAWMRLSTALMYAGRCEEAAHVLGRLEDASPSAEVGSFFRGLSWLARGRIDAAEGSFLRASRSGECTPALSALAALHARRGRPMAALDAAQRALEADPQDIQALLIAHDTASLAGRTILADAYLARALDVQADCVPALLRWFERALRGADPDQVAAVLKKLLRAAPDLPEVQCGLVAHDQSRGHAARARRAARSLVEAYPTHSAAWLAHARLAFEYDERDVALRSIHRALEIAPDDVEIAVEALRIQGNLMPGGLGRLVDRLLRQFPDHWRIVSSAAMALAQPAGNPGWAEELAEHARRLEPRLPLSWGGSSEGFRDDND